MKSRLATAQDASVIARIYNTGIDERVATYETKHRTDEDIQAWFDGKYPVVVIENIHHEVVAFASTSAYRPRDCYKGIAEYSVYVDSAARGQGVGKLAMQALIDAARDAGFWKLISRIFPENQASLRLMKSLGFREVGLYEKHSQLDGVWRDVVIVERLIPENID